MTSMNVWARSRTALSLAAVLALAACGGGGGSSSSSGGTPTTVAVSGVASKGLLAYAKVTAYAIKSDGTADASKVLGSAITDAKGAYQITGLPPSTPVILEVTPLPAEGTRPATTMKDEATGDDVVVTVASGFSLSAAVVLDGTGTTSAQVTPFTDMAAKFAQTQAAGGAPIADAINVANDKIAEVLGVPLNALPTFDETGAPTNAAAIKLAAVSALAQQSGCSTSEGTLAKIQCAVDQLRDEVTDTPVAGEPLLSDAFVSNLNTAQANVDVPAGVTEPAPVTNVDTTVAVGGESKTAIQEAKTLIKSVRDTATALSNQSDANSLASRIKAIEDASYGVAQPLDDGTMTVVNAIEEALWTRSDWIANGTQAAGFPVSGNNWLPFLDGNGGSGCKFYADNTFDDTKLAFDDTTGVLSSTDFLGCRVLQDVVYAQVMSPGGLTWMPSYAVFHGVQLIKKPGGQFTVKSVLKKVTFTTDFEGGNPNVSVVSQEALSAPQEATVTRTASSATVSGAFAPGVESTWEYDTNLGYYNHTIKVLGTRQTVNLTYSDTLNGAITTRALSGAIEVFDGSTVQSTLSLLSGSHVKIKDAALAGGGTIRVMDGAHLEAEGQVNSGYKIHGTLDLSNFTPYQDGSRPRNGTFAGYITDTGGSARLFEGALTMVMPTDTGLNWEATLDGTLVTTGAKKLEVNLTAKQSATVKDDFTVTGRYTQGGNTFFVTVLSSEATLAKNQVSFETPSGIGFVLNPRDPAVTSVDVKKGTTVLGTYDRASSRLVYADGTYERF